MGRYVYDKEVGITDTKTGSSIPFKLACDILNAHDGMMTREQVERLEWENFHFCNHFKDGEAEKRDAVERALKTVINGGTK